jgi:heme A synthase
MSRIGKILCLIYALIIAICMALAYSAGSDYKGQFVFLQLPISIQMAGGYAIGLAQKLPNISWVVAYALYALPTFVFLYLIGWAIDGRNSNPSIKRTPNVKR